MHHQSTLKRALLIGGLIQACMSSPLAWAADEEWAIGEKIAEAYASYTCGQQVPLSSAQPTAYAQLNRLEGVESTGERLPLLLGNSTPWGGGIVVFYSDAGQWQALNMEMGTSVTQVYTNPARTAYWIFFMHTSEAPGNIQYLHLTAKEAHCGELVAPPELNQPYWAMEYVDLVAFNLDAQGHGSVLGRAELDQETDHAHTQWYNYLTRDNGKTWSAPTPTAKNPPLPVGIWQQARVTQPDPALLKDLLR